MTKLSLFHSPGTTFNCVGSFQYATYSLAGVHCGPAQEKKILKSANFGKNECRLVILRSYLVACVEEYNGTT